MTSSRESVLVPGADVRTYYDRPVLKEPIWKWQVPAYFFTGGLGGASAVLAFGARVTGNEVLARRALLSSLAGLAVSPVLLIEDLGRPERFANMLRVAKPTSPMSVGSWILAVAGPAVGGAAVSDVTGRLRRLGRALEAVGALLGPLVATYTAVLVADTAIPAWHEARRDLPFVFAGGSAASAGAAAAMLTPTRAAAPARRMLVGGALVELAASRAMEQRLGELGEPYRTGEAARLGRAAKALTVAGAGLVAVAGRRSRPAAVAGATLTMAGALLERFSVFRAGFESARDPRATTAPQRRRAGITTSRIEGSGIR